MKASMAVVALMLFGGASAQAVTIRFGGITGPDGGTESRFNDANATSGIAPEQVTCDQGASTNCGFAGPANNRNGDGSGNFYHDNRAGVRLAPNGLSTRSDSYGSPYGSFLVVNDVQTQVDNGGPPIYDGFVDYGLGGASALPAGQQTNTPLTYVGFLWGSPDSYNFIQFVDDNGTVVDTSNNFDGLGVTIDGQQYLTGASIYKSLGDGGFSKDPGNAGTIFVNFAFDSEQVSGIRIGNFNNCCFELGNITDDTLAVTDPTPTVGLPSNPRPVGGLPNVVARPALVPEPTAALALVTGMGLLGLARRKRG